MKFKTLAYLGVLQKEESCSHTPEAELEAETEAEGRGQRRRQRAKGRGQRRSLLLPAVAHRRKMGLRQRSDFSPFVLYLLCGFLMGRSVKNIVNHHCFVGFSLHYVFKLGTNTTARNDLFFYFLFILFYFFFRTHFTAASPFVLWVSLYTLFSGMILFYFFSEPILTLLPIRNPQNKYKTKGEKSLLCRNPIFRRCATAGKRSERLCPLPSALCLRLCPLPSALCLRLHLHLRLRCVRARFFLLQNP